MAVSKSCMMRRDLDKASRMKGRREQDNSADMIAPPERFMIFSRLKNQ